MTTNTTTCETCQIHGLSTPATTTVEEVNGDVRIAGTSLDVCDDCRAQAMHYPLGSEHGDASHDGRRYVLTQAAYQHGPDPRCWAASAIRDDGARCELRWMHEPVSTEETPVEPDEYDWTRVHDVIVIDEPEHA